MNYVELNSLCLGVCVLHKRHCSLGIHAVGVVDVSPNTFNVAVVDVLDGIHFTILGVASREVVEALTLPDGQLPVTHSNVVIGVVFGQPSDEVPRLVLSRNHPYRVGSQESHPETVTVLIQVRELISFLVDNRLVLSMSRLQWSVLHFRGVYRCWGVLLGY